MDSKQTKFVQSVMKHVKEEDQPKAESLLVDALENKKTAQAKAPTQTEAVGILQSLFGDDTGSSGASALTSLVGGLFGGNDSGEASSGGGDVLSSLVGGLFSGGSSSGEEKSGGQGGDLVSSLLGGLFGGKSEEGASEDGKAATEKSGILSNLIGILPSLMKLIKPEDIADVKQLVMKFLK